MKPHLVTFSKHDARKAEKDALRRACELTGISLDRAAQVLGEKPDLVRAWASPARDSHSLPAWAWRRLVVALPSLTAAMERLLTTAAPTSLDDAAVVALVRAHAECVAAIATPARHAHDGARAAIAAIARLDGLHRGVCAALQLNASNIARAA